MPKSSAFAQTRTCKLVHFWVSYARFTVPFSSPLKQNGRCLRNAYSYLRLFLCLTALVLQAKLITLRAYSSPRLLRAPKFTYNIIYANCIFIVEWCKSLDPAKAQRAVDYIVEACEGYGSGTPEQIREALGTVIVQRDPWHMVKNQAKILTKIASKKGMAIFSHRKADIIQHLWHCMRTCGGSAEVLESKWKTMVAHLCGKHSWGERSCEHGELSAEELAKPTFQPETEPFEKLKSFVTSRKLLQSMPFYKNFM